MDPCHAPSRRTNAPSSLDQRDVMYERPRKLFLSAAAAVEVAAAAAAAAGAWQRRHEAERGRNFPVRRPARRRHSVIRGAAVMAVVRRGAWRAALCLTTCAAVACAFNVDVRFPLKVSAPQEAVNGSFGFSVALPPAKDGVSSLLVGAPRANALQSGAVYRCQIWPTLGSCSQLALSGSDEIRYLGTVERNVSFFGAAVDVRSEGSVVACNPNWKVREPDEEGYKLLMPGACFYASSIDASFLKRILNKEAAEKHQNLEVKRPNLFSQMGFSVNFVRPSTDESSVVLMGAPGAWSGKGTAAIFNFSSDDPVHPQSPIESLSNSSYFGYSVGSGVFGPSKKLLYIGGAPRAGVLKGKVYLFDLGIISSEKGNITVEKEFTGKQAGEYFGASVAVADLNGDGMDDLLVGAPQRSYERGDEGAVCVFASNAKGELGEEQEIMGSKKPNARFGMSIAALGDINHDGYQDIAVGAPYEDSLQGAVYIYHGTPRPPYLKLVQNIKAHEIDDSLRGFGYSISRGRDMDRNSYNDFAVGAFLSNSAIVLRTSPIVHINAYWSSNVKRLNTSKESLNGSVCLSLGGFNKSGPVEVEVSVQLDPVFNRAYFTDLGVKDSYNSSLTYGKHSCKPVIIVSKNFTKIFKPLEIVLEYRINPSSSVASFCAHCPILDPENNTATLRIPYDTGCNSEDCKIDVELHADFVDAPSQYVVGNGSVIVFVMNVSNALEPSFETNISVNISAEISLTQIDRFCQIVDEKGWNVTVLLCTVPKTLEKDVKGHAFRLEMDGNSAPWGMRELVLSARAEGSGEEVNPEDNELTRRLPLHHAAEIYAVGRSQPPSLSYTMKKNTSDEIIYQNKLFKHTYQVNNDGPSPVDDVVIRFMIPGTITFGEEVFNLTDVDEKKLPESISCRRSILDEPINANLVVNATHLKSDFELPDTYFRVDCSVSNVRCLVLECLVTYAILARSGQSVSLEMTALLKELGPVIEEGAILLHTWGIVESAHIKNENLLNNKSDVCITETLFLGQRPVSRIQPWIIVIAILFGILLLAILILVLWKVGFFKRKTFTPQENEAIDNEHTDPLCEGVESEDT